MSAADADRGMFGRAWAAWERFWFSPADPTPLCLMRIVTGLLVLYVHIAYTFDLHAFFGPKGWYGADQANRERREWPNFVAPSSWGPEARFRMPAIAEQCRALRIFMENSARDPAKRTAVNRLLRSLPQDAEARVPLVSYLQKLTTDYADFPARDEELRKMVHTKPEDLETQRRLPSFLLSQLEPQREMFRADAHDFIDVLPPDHPTRGQLFWLLQTTGQQNFGVLATIIDRLGAMSDAERESYLNYCEYWTVPPDDPAVVAKGHGVYSPFYHITDPRALELLHYLHLFVIVLFTVGFCTRVTGVLTWLAALAYIQRSPLTLFGQDTMMNLCLVYLILSPCGATWSVDWLIARYRAGRSALRGGQRPAETGPRPQISAGFAIRLLQVQYCMMYMSAGLAKLKGESWWNGTAPWLCMTNPEFSPLHIDWFRQFLVWLCQDGNRPLWELYMNSTTVFTLFLEIGFPFLVWTRMRPVMVAGAVLLHFGIATNMGLIVFSLFMFALLLAWMPPEAVRRVFARPPSQLEKVRLRYGGQDPKQVKVAATAYALDVWEQVEFADRGRDANAGKAELIAGGTAATGYALAQRLAATLAMTRPIAWLLRMPGIAHLGRAIYDGDTTPAAAERDEPARRRPGQKPVASR